MWGHRCRALWSYACRHLPEFAKAPVRHHYMIQVHITEWWLPNNQIWLFPYHQLWEHFWRGRGTILIQPHPYCVPQCTHGVSITRHNSRLHAKSITLKVFFATSSLLSNLAIWSTLPGLILLVSRCRQEILGTHMPFRLVPPSTTSTLFSPLWC